MRYIEFIEISKFRSFGAEEKFELLDLNVFSGGNDSGKSNVLKALNLFFNNQTDLNTPFSPDNDFNKWFRDNKERGQRNIKIKLIFSKGNYKDPTGINAGFIAEKEFRDDGGIDVNFYQLNGTKINKSDDNLSYRKANAVISEKIRYIYIPTIRDSKFRGSVQRLIESLALSTDKRFKDQNQQLKTSFDSLERNLAGQLTELKTKLSEVMKINIRANVNFGTLLESLSFETDSNIKINKRKGNSETQEIELRNRGEGIQMQFFSFLLWFISKNDTKHNYIWGFEEPEIAFELKRQFELAENFFQGDFLQYVQILITTHSPAFAFLDEKQNSKIYRVAFTQDKSTKRDRFISKVIPVKVYYDGLFEKEENSNIKNNQALENDIWGINIQKISKIIGSSLSDVIKHRHISDSEFIKLKEILIATVSEKVAFEKEADQLKKEFLSTYPQKIFICEDDDLKIFWKNILSTKCGLTGIDVRSSGGCQNNKVETALIELKSINKEYNPIVFRQIDRDGFLDEQIIFLEKKQNEKFKNFKKYSAKYLPVNEIENFGYLMNDRFKNSDIKEKVYDEANDAFVNTIKNNIQVHSKNLKVEEKKIITKEKEMKTHARGDYLKFFPGKEFKKINNKFNPIRKIEETDFNDYPVELKLYLQSIIDFFTNGTNTVTNTTS